MKTFITTGQYSDHAYQGMLKTPEDRSETVAKLFQAAGAKMVGYYITFGENDFLVIAEAEDELAMMSALIVAAGTGGVRNLKTTMAVSTAQAKTAMTKAQGMVAGFKPAGG